MYSCPVRSAAFAIFALVEVRPAETHTSHDQPQSVQNLVAVGYFACSFAVFAPDLVVGHPLPCHFVVAAQARIASSIYSGCWTQQLRVESQRGFVWAVLAMEGQATFESLDVRKDAARGAPAETLDPLYGCQGCLLVEDERLGKVPAGYCTVEERLRGTVEIGGQRAYFEVTQTGFSGIRVVPVRVDGSIARGQVSLCRQLKNSAGSRWTTPILPGSAKDILQWSFESEDIGVRTIPGAVAPVASVRQKRYVQQASMKVGCSVCSLSSSTNVNQKAALVSTSCVPSPVASTVAVLLEEEDTRKL